MSIVHETLLPQELGERRMLWIARMALPAVLAFTTVTALAQVTQPVRLVVPFTSGGASDTGARILAPYLAELMNRPVIVENKPGASGAIGTVQVARASADGTTVLVGTSSSMGSSPIVKRDLPYDVLKDFVPVGTVSISENVLAIHPSIPASTVQQFIAYAKANPRKIAYGSSGLGSTYHLATEMFSTRTGIALVHVPYKGAAQAAQDLYAGHVQLVMQTLHESVPNFKAGKVKILGIASPNRSPALPDVPTFAEQGVTGCEYSQWTGFFLPANSPPALVIRLNADLNAALARQDVKEKFARVGLRPAPGRPEDLATTLANDHVRWAKVVSDARISLER